MIKFILILIAVLLTGCATPPQFLAEMYDRNDPCQTRAELGRPAGYQRPDWCGAASGRRYIYNNQNQRIGYVR